MLLDLLEGRLDAEATTGKTTVAELARELPRLKDRNPRALADALAAVFRHDLAEPAQDDDPASANALAHLIVDIFLRPPSSSATPSPEAADKALSALAALSAAALSAPDLVRVAAHTDPDDAWTTPSAAAVATAILDARFDADPARLAEFIRSGILEAYLRPLFSRSRSERITPAGRKAHYPDAGRGAASTDEDGSRPWKHDDKHAVTVFAWAVSHADERLVSESWPLFLPVLLALLDEPETAYRLRGLRIARAFVARCPGHRLRDTGLGELLAQSILPTFNFLPSLTPEADSAALLDAAYPAAVLLARTQFDRPADADARRALLARVLRDGVFAGYWHAKQHIRIVEVLARQSAAIVDELQLAATPHLKDLVPMYSEMLSDPFASGYPGYLLSAVRGLQTVMRNCWPRIATPHHQGEILKAMTLAWLSLQDDDAYSGGEAQKTSHEETRAALVETAAMLAAICSAAGVDLAEQTSKLVASDKTLEGLFGAPAVRA